jgi:glutaredoxin
MVKLVKSNNKKTKKGNTAKINKEFSARTQKNKLTPQKSKPNNKPTTQQSKKDSIDIIDTTQQPKKDSIDIIDTTQQSKLALFWNYICSKFQRTNNLPSPAIIHIKNELPHDIRKKIKNQIPTRNPLAVCIDGCNIAWLIGNMIREQVYDYILQYVKEFPDHRDLKIEQITFPKNTKYNTYDISSYLQLLAKNIIRKNNLKYENGNITFHGNLYTQTGTTQTKADQKSSFKLNKNNIDIFCIDLVILYAEFIKSVYKIKELVILFPVSVYNRIFPRKCTAFLYTKDGKDIKMRLYTRIIDSIENNDLAYCKIYDDDAILSIVNVLVSSQIHDNITNKQIVHKVNVDTTQKCPKDKKPDTYKQFNVGPQPLVSPDCVIISNDKYEDYKFVNYMRANFEDIPNIISPKIYIKQNRIVFNTDLSKIIEIINKIDTSNFTLRVRNYTINIPDLIKQTS